MQPQLTILLIEDDANERESMQAYMQTQEDIALVGATGSAFEGMKLLGQLKPDVIILDLELLDGNGITFLEDMQLMRLSYRPFVFVTTRTRAGVVRDAVEALGAQYFYCKNNPAYSPKAVIGILKSLFKFNDNRSAVLIPNTYSQSVSEVNEKRNEDIIPTELTAQIPNDKEKRRALTLLLAHLSIPVGKEANSYLTDAILIVHSHMGRSRQMPELKNDVYPLIAQKYGVKPDSVDRNLRYSLETAWARTLPAVIDKHYPFPTAPDRDCPSPKEFIFNIASTI